MAKGKNDKHAGNDKGMREAGPGEKADFIRVTRGNADYGEPVKRQMASLHGQSRKDLERDQERGARSPLGGGSHSKGMTAAEKKRRMQEP